MSPSGGRPPWAADDLPMSGMVVLDFSQFLAGPVAALRLADLGARVIKIERPAGGDAGRQLAFASIHAGDDSLSFQAMNRSKESYAADLKSPGDLAGVRELVRHADVIIQNFRPGVMARYGLDYAGARQLRGDIVYGSVSGYGTTGPWKNRPGQDLLAQAISGLPWLSGSRDDGPVPVGLALADLLASIHLAHGITALLLRRGRTGRGGIVETSLLEGLLDLEFELLSAATSAPSLLTDRGTVNSAHAFLPAPYGIYKAKDGYLAIAMNPVPELGEALGVPALNAFADPATWWKDRDLIVAIIADHLRTATVEHWLGLLDAADAWAAPVQSLQQLMHSDGFAAVDMMQRIGNRAASGKGPEPGITTTRSPLRIDSRTLTNPAGAPRLGENTEAIRAEFGICRV
jgi:CoA:oxalate CoA-transferase